MSSTFEWLKMIPPNPKFPKPFEQTISKNLRTWQGNHDLLLNQKITYLYSMKKAPKSNKKKGKQTNRKEEGNIYDKIMRENLQEIFMPLVEQKLKLKIKKFQALPDKQETTLERETDAFLLIDSEDGKQFILHLEFQVVDDHKMIYRMAEHHGIELRKFRLPIKHVVIYLGEKKPTMPTKLKPNEVFRAFSLVDVHKFTPKKWLSSQVPSEIILAILANYKEEDTEKILQAILKKLKRVCKTPNELGKCIKQLVILSRLRGLEAITLKITRDMPLLIDIEKDYLYQLGMKKANERAKKVLQKIEIEKQQAERERQQAERERQQAEEKLYIERLNSIQKMQENGVAKEMIALFLGLSMSDIEGYIGDSEK